ncbi:hypothetical protein TH62_21085 [Bacillus sp. TH008]|nr:hypothetical protein TH62_21085 [Bacillus sp. TH008]
MEFWSEKMIRNDFIIFFSYINFIWEGAIGNELPFLSKIVSSLAPSQPLKCPGKYNDGGNAELISIFRTSLIHYCFQRRKMK